MIVGESGGGDGGCMTLLNCDSVLISPHGWRARGVRSLFWRLYANSRDGAALELAGEAGSSFFELEAGGVCLVPPGVWFHCVCSAPVEHFYACFDLPCWPTPAASVVLDTPLRAHDEGGQLFARVRRFARSVQGVEFLDMARGCTLKSLLWEALGLCLQSLPREKRVAPNGTGGAAVARALRFIEANLGEAVPNSVLAKLCGWSEDHFARRFRECVGQSPAQYVVSRRVALASQKLLFSGSSIELIARECGFGNRFYFSRVFALHMGMAPAAYRKSPRV